MVEGPDYFSRNSAEGVKITDAIFEVSATLTL
jgi:hypothetical protein